MSNYFDTWESVADDAVSVLMARPQLWTDVIEAGIVNEDFPPGHWRIVWKPIIESAAGLKEPRALLDTEIATVTGVPVTWLAERLALYDEPRHNAWSKTLENLLAFGRGHRQLTAMQRSAKLTLVALNNGLEVEQPAQDLITALQIEHTGHREHKTDLASLMAENRSAMDADPNPGDPTGIWLIDGWLGGGLSQNEFVAWVAPYKSRKTGVMCNVLLAALEHGQRVNVFEFDELRASFIYRMESMLMAKYMWDNGHYDNPLNNISQKMIRQAGKLWRTWPKPLPQAFEYAFDTLSGYGRLLNIYDQQTCSATPENIAGLCRIDASRAGLDMIFVDHLQRLRGFKRIFDKVEEGSDFFNALRGELACKVWMLSQQNEEAIKGGDTQASHSPNVKGGGGLASSADTIFVSKYKKTFDDPRALKVELRQARYDESGVSDWIEVHPASGWITPRVGIVQTLDLAEIAASADVGQGAAPKRVERSGGGYSHDSK